jgi:DNA-binding response OmpR family regulator
MRLFIIDDNPDLRLLISTQLRSQTRLCSALPTSFGRSARPDVILLEIELPGDSFLVLGCLKADKLLSAIPVIIVTTRDPKELRVKRSKSGLSRLFTNR